MIRFAVAALTLLMAVSTAQADSVKELYDKSCTFCHASGAAGAPVSHDEAAWEPRMEKDMETLVKHAREGYKGMPPKGMCNDCSDEEYRALIEYMSQTQ